MRYTGRNEDEDISLQVRGAGVVFALVPVHAF